jgi:DNA-binding MarR family transcriptional regulator
MKNKTILLQLVELLDMYENEHIGNEQASFQEFLAFVNTRQDCKVENMREMAGNSGDEVKRQSTIYSDISVLVVLLNRYARGYIKKGLQHSLIQTPEEFSFLITLITYESLTKTALIQLQIMEKASGMEVIKRLLKNELIVEFADPQDKRSMRVAISEKGKQLLLEMMPTMSKVTQLIAGKLNNQELHMLHYLLKKLDHLHFELFTKHRNDSLDDLLSIVAQH